MSTNNTASPSTVTPTATPIVRQSAANHGDIDAIGGVQDGVRLDLDAIRAPTEAYLGAHEPASTAAAVLFPTSVVCNLNQNEGDIGRKSSDNMTLPSTAKVIYRIETIFVMDEKPFCEQWAKKSALGAGQKDKGDNTKGSASKKPDGSDLESLDQTETAQAAGKQPKAGAKNPSSVIKSKNKKQPNKREMQCKKSDFDKLAAKQSALLQGETPLDTMKRQLVESAQVGAQTHKDGVKNLLQEFDQDDTPLEPDMKMYNTGAQASTTPTIAVEQDAQKPKVAIQRGDEGGKVWQNRESLMERSERKNGPPARGVLTKNKDMKIYEKDQSADQVPMAITLQNQKSLPAALIPPPSQVTDQQQPVSKAKSTDLGTPVKVRTSVEGEPQRDSSPISQRLRGLMQTVSDEDFFEGQPELRIRFTEIVRKFNLELMKSTCQVMKGCKAWKAKQIADSVFAVLNQVLQHNADQAGNNSTVNDEARSGQPETPIPAAIKQLAGGAGAGARKESESSGPTHLPLGTAIQRANGGQSTRFNSSDEVVNFQQGGVHVVKQVTTSVSTLKDILNYCFQLNSYQKPDCLKEFLVASLLMQSKINVIVLLAGTSGTGKSTLASLLGTQLGISTVLSTDSVRHVMRNFIKEQDNPTLFCSTYEAGKVVPEEDRKNASENWVTLKGYKKQCALVTKELAKTIDSFYKRNESVIVEGVHLTPSFLKDMMSKYPTCIPFVLYIKQKTKHGERFAVRAKHMTIDPRFNKYINNIQHIRTIQEYLLKKSEEVLIPRVENHNVDRSVSFIQATIMRCLHRISEGHLVYDASQKRATGIHKVVQSIQKNQLSSKQALSVIQQKVDRVQVVEDFLKSANQQAELDPAFERKLTQHRLSASFEALPVNIWKCGEFASKADSERDEEDIKRSASIVNLQSTQEGDSQLSKVEKKKIKRDLLEFAKASQGLNKEHLIRKGLIENEEDLEAKICEGSEAKSILEDHRKNVQKYAEITLDGQAVGEKSSGGVSLRKTASTIDATDNERDVEAEELDQKYLAKKLMSDLQKQNELILLKEALRRAEQQLQKEETAQMKEVLKETMQKTKRNKSQEPTGLCEADVKQNNNQMSDDGRQDSQDSLEVLADDEDEQQRLREVIEADGIEADLVTGLTTSSHKPNHPQDRAGLKDNSGKKTWDQIFVSQKYQMEQIQQVNLQRVVQDSTSANQGGDQSNLQGLHAMKKDTSFKYKLDTMHSGSVDNLIQKAAAQKKGEQGSQGANRVISSFGKADLQESANKAKKVAAAGTRDKKRLKQKTEKSSYAIKKRQLSAQFNQDDQREGDTASKPTKQAKITLPQSKKQSKPQVTTDKETSQEHQSSVKAIQAASIEETKDQSAQPVGPRAKMRRERTSHRIDKRSMTTNTFASTRSDVASGSEHERSVKDDNATVESARAVAHHQEEAQQDGQRIGASTRPNQDQKSNDGAHSNYGSISKAIEEEDSEYSQTIGSLVSYTINYMEKKTYRGGNDGQSSRPDNDRINEVDHSDSDSDDDHSLLAEKEDSHSDIDTIEEEVDLSSEGSDHEDQEDPSHAEQDQQTNQTKNQVQAASALVQVLDSAAAAVSSCSPQPSTQAQAQGQAQAQAQASSRDFQAASTTYDQSGTSSAAVI